MRDSKQIVRTGPFKNLVASGVRVGDLITLSGQISIDGDGVVVGAGDIRAQLQQIYFNLKDILEEF